MSERKQVTVPAMPGPSVRPERDLFAKVMRALSSPLAITGYAIVATQIVVILRPGQPFQLTKAEAQILFVGLLTLIPLLLIASVVDRTDDDFGNLAHLVDIRKEGLVEFKSHLDQLDLDKLFADKNYMVASKQEATQLANRFDKSTEDAAQVAPRLTRIARVRFLVIVLSLVGITIALIGATIPTASLLAFLVVVPFFQMVFLLTPLVSRTVSALGPREQHFYQFLYYFVGAIASGVTYAIASNVNITLS
jgi:hypothetical protein